MIQRYRHWRDLAPQNTGGISHTSLRSMYKLLIIGARRALELSEGSPRLVEASPKEKPALLALREIAEGKVTFKLKPKKEAKE